MGPLFVAEGVSLGDLRYATRVKLAEQQRRPSFVVELRRGLRYATRDLAEGGPVFAYGSAEVCAPLGINSLRDFWIDGCSTFGYCKPRISRISRSFDFQVN